MSAGRLNLSSKILSVYKKGWWHWRGHRIPPSAAGRTPLPSIARKGHRKQGKDVQAFLHAIRTGTSQETLKSLSARLRESALDCVKSTGNVADLVGHSLDDFTGGAGELDLHLLLSSISKIRTRDDDTQGCENT
jgi:hypothetical protein